MVPGSTLMYGSILTSVTRRPRASRSAPIDAEATPLPSDDTTPPVTKMNFVFDPLFVMHTPRRTDPRDRAPAASHPVHHAPPARGGGPPAPTIGSSTRARGCWRPSPTA